MILLCIDPTNYELIYNINFVLYGCRPNYDCLTLFKASGFKVWKELVDCGSTIAKSLREPQESEIMQFSKESDQCKLKVSICNLSFNRCALNILESTNL